MGKDGFLRETPRFAVHESGLKLSSSFGYLASIATEI
jgi:hypothetical protein